MIGNGQKSVKFIVKSLKIIVLKVKNIVKLDIIVIVKVNIEVMDIAYVI